MARAASNATAAQALRSSGQAEAYATVAGNGTAGSLGDGGAAASAQLSLKLDSLYMRSGIAVAADGTIFIADTENATIRRVSPGASAGGARSQNASTMGAGVARIWSNDMVAQAEAYATENGLITSVAGKWGPTQSVQLVEPMGLALDRAGNLYIADHGANAVIELHDATASTPGKLEMLAQVAKAARCCGDDRWQPRLYRGAGNRERAAI